MPVPYREPDNIVWQTQVDAPPSPYARALAASLERIFGAGVHDLEGVLARLNAEGPRPEGAEAWTAELFEAEMRRLGA